MSVLSCLIRERSVVIFGQEVNFAGIQASNCLRIGCRRILFPSKPVLFAFVNLLDHLSRNSFFCRYQGSEMCLSQDSTTSILLLIACQTPNRAFPLVARSPLIILFLLDSISVQLTCLFSAGTDFASLNHVQVKWMVTQYISFQQANNLVILL